MFSVRLVEQAAQGEGWEGAGVREAVELLPGPHFQHTRGQGAAGGGGRGRGRGRSRGRRGEKKVVLVFYVGGVTLAEVAALRFLSARAGSSVQYVVAATSLLTGDSLMASLYTPPGPRDPDTLPALTHNVAYHDYVV